MAQSSDTWTEYNCIKLIREFRKNRILWDPKDPFFYKKTMKPIIWAEIGQRIGMPPEECKHKMVILMSSFRREKAKIMQSIKDEDQDISNCYKSTWFAFQEMAFLMDKETERKRQAKEYDSEIDQPTLKKRMLERHIQPPISSENLSRKRASAMMLKKELTRMIARVAAGSTMDSTENLPGPSTERPANYLRNEITRIAPSTEIPKQTVDDSPGPSVIASNEADEEIKSFATFIANKMKKYSEMTKNRVQRAICDIIFKADQGDFDKKRVTAAPIRSESDSLEQNLQFDLDDDHSIKVEDIVESYSDSD